jgi:hypothetical protein
MKISVRVWVTNRRFEARVGSEIIATGDTYGEITEAVSTLNASALQDKIKGKSIKQYEIVGRIVDARIRRIRKPQPLAVDLA